MIIQSGQLNGYKKYQFLKYRIAIIIKKQGEMLAFMEPDFLADYQRLIQNQLQKQLVTYEQSLPQMPSQFRQFYKNQELKLCLGTNDYPRYKYQQQEMIEEDVFLRQMYKYNISKLSKSRYPKSKDIKQSTSKQQSNNNRKRRTLITPEKLKLMNQLFKQYVETSQQIGSQNSCQDYNPNLPKGPNLKEIARTLELGYSTVLHKFRQYRSTNRVKPGALIKSIFQKRKYNKSVVLQELLNTCLQEKTFYTASQVSEYIKQKYNKTYTRSLISRHLGQMGYSCKNLTVHEKWRNETKSMRKKYAVAFEAINRKPNSEVYYLDQYVFQFTSQKKEGQEIKMQNRSQKQIHVTVLASKKEILKYELAQSAMDQLRFSRFWREIKKYFEQRPQNPKILVLDLDKKLHYSQNMLQARNQLKNQNVYMFYLPPNSHQMNLLQWFFTQTKQKLQNHTFKDFRQFKYTIDKILKQQQGQILQSYQETAMKYIQLSLQNENF